MTGSGPPIHRRSLNPDFTISDSTARADDHVGRRRAYGHDVPPAGGGEGIPLGLCHPSDRDAPVLAQLTAASHDEDEIFELTVAAAVGSTASGSSLSTITG
jgi:hypothetical protein